MLRSEAEPVQHAAVSPARHGQPSFLNVPLPPQPSAAGDCGAVTDGCEGATLPGGEVTLAGVPLAAAGAARPAAPSGGLPVATSGVSALHAASRQTKQDTYSGVG